MQIYVLKFRFYQFIETTFTGPLNTEGSNLNYCPYDKVFIRINMKSSIWNHAYALIDFLRLPRPQGERRKSIYSPWGWGK